MLIKFWARLLLLSGVVALKALGARPPSFADPSYLIDSWNTEEGWPGAAADTMAQTPDGYLWLGTLKGLVRFDGTEFHVFDPSGF